MTEAPWLSVIGIGEDGLVGLGSRAAEALAEARTVFGGARHLAMLAEPVDARPWASPIEARFAEIEAAREAGPVAVLASGDPSWFGIGRLLVERFGAGALAIHPAPSSLSLAAARLGWPLDRVGIVSVCGRPLETVWPALRDGARLLVLSAGSQTPSALAEGLARRGYGESRLVVLEALGGANERIRETCAEAFALADVAALNLVAVECRAAHPHGRLPASAGLADDLFLTDGTMTKRVVRAAALSALEPRAGELLWDIGAGSGSVAVEWLRAGPRMRAIAVEPRADRRALTAANAERFCVAGLSIVEGRAPDALPDLERPDAVFVGGGLSEATALVAVGALRPGGRLVAHGVTLETQALLAELHEVHGGELLRIGIEAAEPLGRFRGWRPAMPVVHWHWRKATA